MAEGQEDDCGDVLVEKDKQQVVPQRVETQVQTDLVVEEQVEQSVEDVEGDDGEGHVHEEVGLCVLEELRVPPIDFLELLVGVEVQVRQWEGRLDPDEQVFVVDQVPEFVLDKVNKVKNLFDGAVEVCLMIIVKL